MKGALDIDWDGWPDGTFSWDFTFEEADTYNNLQVHWATKTHGVRGGDNFAEEWVNGKRYIGIAWESLSATTPTALSLFDHKHTQRGSTGNSGRPVNVGLSWVTSGALSVPPYGHFPEGCILQMLENMNT